MSKYIVCIGTSHTYGDCENNVTPYTWAHQCADALGVELKRYAVSGGENLELLQIVNEIKEEILNENCVGVIADVRVHSWMMFVPHTTYVDPSTTDNGHKPDLSNHAGLKTWNEYINDPATSWPFTGMHSSVINRQLYQTKGARSNEIDSYKKGYVYDSGDNGETDPAFDTPMAHVKLNACVDAVNVLLDGNNRSRTSTFFNMQLVCAMKNIIEGQGIPFAWFDFEDGDFSICDYKDYDYDINATQLKFDVAPAKWDKDIRCACGHVNEVGHILLGDLIATKLTTDWLRK